MRKIKLSNHTDYDGRDLRRLICAVCERLLDPDEKPWLIVSADYKRRGAQVDGRAVVGGHRVYLLLNKDEQDPVDLAVTIGHELGHIQGLGHREMKGAAQYGYRATYSFYAWAKDYPLRRHPPQPKVRPTGAALADEKLAHAIAKSVEWERKLKAADTRLKKWQRQVRYYQRRLAALKVKPSSN